MGTTPLSVNNQISVLTFSGQSSYSSDFQTILTKAVQTDTIQLSGLDDQVNNDQNRLGTLQSLDQTYNNLQTAINNLNTAMGPTALSATVGNPSLASVTLGTGATAGTYSLEVDDAGAPTQVISSSGNRKVTDPNAAIPNATQFELGVSDPSVNGGATQYTTINNPSSTMEGLVQAINQTPGLGVTASVVNVGPNGSPDYRFVLQSTSLAAVSITLGVGNSQTAPNIMNTLSTGRNASYIVDGTSITGNSDTITLAPGVTVNLLQASPGNPTTVTVSQSTTNAQTALQQFATAYNGVVDALATQHGQKAGSLSGDSLLMEAHQVLSAITGPTNLSQVGLDMDDQGHLTFNASEFATGAGANFNSLSQFIGNSTTGFIATATNAINGLEDPTTGIFKTAESSLSSEITALNGKIADQISAVNQFQQNLYDQLAQSDAAIFSLSSQNMFFQQMFQTQTANLMGGH